MKRMLLAALLLLAGSAMSAETRQKQPLQKISKHASARMRERGVPEIQVRLILKDSEPFKYYHQDRWKTGYYDEKSRIFLATDDDVVITVITNATPIYVERLKGKKP